MLSAAMFPHLSQAFTTSPRNYHCIISKFCGFPDLNGFEFQIPNGMKNVEKKALLSLSYRGGGGGEQYPPAGVCLAVLKGLYM